MGLLDQPLAEAEFIAVDCETNGRSGADCELTEVGAVLVGGGELHASLSSLVAVQLPLTRGVQRLTGITEAMLAAAPEPRPVLTELATWLAGRVLVAHSASFDRRVLRQACERAEVPWPDPPALCTLALARRMLPLQRERKLAALADALGIEVTGTHRALPDADTCGRILCALLPRLRSHATTVGEAVGLLAAGRRRRRRGVSASRPAGSGPPMPARGSPGRRVPSAEIEFAELPREPGVYIFRDIRGVPVYIGKSVCVASRARSHFAPSGGQAPWTAHAEVVDYQPTASELGALILENRLIKRHRPAGNIRLAPRPDRGLFLRCRLDVPFPVLEVGSAPAPGHAVNIGPVHGRSRAVELVEQLDSLFGLRHCGRRLRRREHPSLYGQMGRCLSPCLGDLDPNLYRARLESALALFGGSADGRDALLGHVESEMRAAATAQLYERAAALRRRLSRLRRLLADLGGLLRATHSRPLLVLAAHTGGSSSDALWLVAGRIRAWERLAGSGGLSSQHSVELESRTRDALLAGGQPGLGAHVPADEVDEVRIVAGWLAGHPEVPTLPLDPPPSAAALKEFVDSQTARLRGPPPSRAPSTAIRRTRPAISDPTTR